MDLANHWRGSRSLSGGGWSDAMLLISTVHKYPDRASSRMCESITRISAVEVIARERPVRFLRVTMGSFKGENEQSVRTYRSYQTWGVGVFFAFRRVRVLRRLGGPFASACLGCFGGLGASGVSRTGRVGLRATRPFWGPRGHHSPWGASFASSCWEVGACWVRRCPSGVRLGRVFQGALTIPRSLSSRSPPRGSRRWARGGGAGRVG
jgi:hypothetical protein